MWKGIVLLPALLWPAITFAQQPPAPPPTSNSPVATKCAAGDALCILADRLKNKDPGIGSRSGTTPGFVAKQAPDAVVPGGRIDNKFIKDFKT